MDKQYRAAKAARFSDEHAARFGQEIELVTAKAGGITPAGVLQLARKKKSAMHDYFDWDNEIAGPKWRLHQARYILRNIVVTHGEGDDAQEVRAFVNVQVVSAQANPGPVRRSIFVTIERALSEEDLRAQIINKALGELTGWRQRYSDYCELAGVFKAIDKVESATA